ncbi:hypothetical protein GlitD10_0972 [Gloeomargarita lithophora Alchichica-D10]|uniref:Uncharacterized protein n=1 Tax=Gloeomargarita lithophora Alchichica-D10 TaxID=1188229 RepID=A0A1J0ABH6_9CYAN|nr:hypothetical protein [Gloeomargarita lithophora]APB33290.1 hypothetical protein GlitD10_0972 [Gloeomargarita lithophora Alchichica-D10]
MRPQMLLSLSVAGTVLAAAMAPASAQPAPKLYDPPVMTTTAAKSEAWPPFTKPFLWRQPNTTIQFPKPSYYEHPFAIERSMEPFKIGIKKTTGTSATPVTDKFRIPPFRDYTGDGVQNLDDIPAHQKNYNDLLKKWASTISTCSKQRGVMFRQVGKEQVPIQINGDPGKVQLNANNIPVCPG